MTRVAVIGAGKLGSVHARILARMPEADLVGVLDVSAEAADMVAARNRTGVLPNLDAVRAAADACVIAVPTAFHRQVALPLLEAGIPCLVEKPLASTPDEGRALVDAARSNGGLLMVGHVERFNPAVQALLDQGLEPRFFEVHRVSPFSFRSADVGVVLDMMIHDIDLILHLVRSPLKDVHAVGVGVLGEHEDMANARLLFENGAVANVTASRVALKTERKLRLFAKDVYVTVDFRQKTGRVVRLAPGVRRRLASGELSLGDMSPLEAMLKKMVRSETLKVKGKEEPLLTEDREFLAAIREGRDPAVTGEHGVRAMETAARVVSSIRANLERA